MNYTKISSLFILFVVLLSGCKAPQAPSTGFTMGTAVNPVLNADVPDPCLIRVDDAYYLVSTTMHLMPGAPIMKSKDLVNWETVSYVFDRLTDMPKYDMIDGTVYGRGQWATSIRYHNGKFYVFFSPNDEPGIGYIYSTTDPEKEPWQLVSKTPHFHDASLFFDDDGRVFIFHDTGMLRELNADLSGVKPGGIDMNIIQRDSTETQLLEGTHVLKKDGKYYVMMISMVYNVPGRIRREVCYRADNITGPYEKKVILETEFEDYGGVGQGFIVDTPEGDWYGLIFQDRGGIGRVPILMPCRWIDGWPILGNEDGTISKTYQMPLSDEYRKGYAGSDDFASDRLSLYWQWNHNPVDDKWSLTERPGFLRLRTARVAENLYKAMNTITQRMIAPQCQGTVSLDLSNMKDGDVAGLSAFNGHSGVLSVRKEGDRKFLVMTEEVVHFDKSDSQRSKSISHVDVEEKERVEIKQNTIYLRITCDFRDKKEQALFFYSLDNKGWKRIGTEFKMRFDWTKLFMGTKFAVFNYATKELGGYVDVDGFEFEQPAQEELHVYLCLGQSNMEGNARVEAQDTVGVPSRFRVLQAVDCPDRGLEKGKWYTAVPPLTRCGTGLSPADYFGRTMVENLPGHIKVGVINVSVGGCKIELFDKAHYQEYVAQSPDWLQRMVNEYDGNPYARLVEMAKVAQRDGGIIKGILLHQGESNTGDEDWPQKVKLVYDSLLADLDLEANSVPLLAGELLNADQDGACASMNAIIQTLPEVIPTARVISSAGCEGREDHLHFSAAGYRELGKRYAKEMIGLYNK